MILWATDPSLLSPPLPRRVRPEPVHIVLQLTPCRCRPRLKRSEHASMRVRASISLLSNRVTTRATHALAHLKPDPRTTRLTILVPRSAPKRGHLTPTKGINSGTCAVPRRCLPRQAIGLNAAFHRAAARLSVSRITSAVIPGAWLPLAHDADIVNCLAARWEVPFYPRLDADGA